MASTTRSNAASASTSIEHDRSSAPGVRRGAARRSRSCRGCACRRSRSRHGARPARTGRDASRPARRAGRAPGRRRSRPGRCDADTCRRRSRTGRRAPRRACPAIARTRSIRSGVAWNWWVTSSPAIISGTPDPNTIAAASGSAQMLNSADGVAVAERAAAHHRDPGDPAGEIGRRLQRPGDVGLRPDRHEPDPLGRPAGVDDERDGVGPVERCRWASGRSAPSSPRLAVDERCEVGRFDQRPIAAGVDRHVDPEQVAHDERVPGGPFERCIPGDRGDADQVGEAGGDDDRDRVVVARDRSRG